MNNPVLVTMRGPQDIDIRNLSNYEAGLAMLGLIHRLYPGITFGQLPALAAQGRTYGDGAMGWSITGALRSVGDTLSPTKIYNGIADKVGDVKDGVGDVLKSTFDSSGSAGGDVVRLFTDKKVIDGANSSYASFTQSGGIFGAVGGSGLSNFLGGEDGSSQSGASSFMEWISHLGSSAKNQAGVAGLPGGVWPWAIAGGAVLFFVFGKKDK